jgi:hypothetical protein
MPGTTYSVLFMIVALAVIAASAVAVAVIAAWLAYQVAKRAIDKATPEGVASVVLALASLIDPLHKFLPWSGRGTGHHLPSGGSGRRSGQDDDGDEAAPFGGGES